MAFLQVLHVGFGGRQVARCSFLLVTWPTPICPHWYIYSRFKAHLSMMPLHYHPYFLTHLKASHSSKQKNFLYELSATKDSNISYSAISEHSLYCCLLLRSECIESVTKAMPLLCKKQTNKHKNSFWIGIYFWDAGF